MGEIVAGYRYNNPQALKLGEFEVVRFNPAARNFYEYAAIYQAVINEALTAGLAPACTPEQVAQEANPESPELRYAQEGGLLTSGRPGKPHYFHSRKRPPGSYAWEVLGIAKAKYADGRSRKERLLRPGPPHANNLADIGDNFVRPHSEALGIDLWGQGIGVAQVRSMLDVYDDDLTLVFYEFPELNPRILPLVEKFGFAKSKRHAAREVEYCGQVSTMYLFEGPLAGDMKERLDETWVGKREQINGP